MVFVILVLVFENFIVFNNYKKETSLVDNKNLENFEKSKIKNAGFWDENDVPFIHIKSDNWSVSGDPWIQVGTGTWNDPHIIENITINGQNSRTCILIEDSNEYFIIQSTYQKFPVIMLSSSVKFFVNYLFKLSFWCHQLIVHWMT